MFQDLRVQPVAFLFVKVVRNFTSKHLMAVAVCERDAVVSTGLINSHDSPLKEIFCF
jgi:hypothetical protein